MRIALLADIHGNSVALDAVTEELASLACDRIVFLGDAAFGPCPQHAVATLRELDALCVLGNTDAWMLDPPAEPPTADGQRKHDAVYFWFLQQLGRAERDFLHTFQPSVRIPLDGHTALLCCHGSPRALRDMIVDGTPAADIDDMLAGHNIDILAAGHTHLPMFRRHRDMTLVNPGSVGMPTRPGSRLKRRPPCAEYAVLTWENKRLAVDFRRLPLDLDAIIQLAPDSGMPHPELWIHHWQ